MVDLFAEWLKTWQQRQPKGAIPPRLFPVGRLDVQSVGLIFVTNDGDWAHRRVGVADAERAVWAGGRRAAGGVRGSCTGSGCPAVNRVMYS